MNSRRNYSTARPSEPVESVDEPVDQGQLWRPQVASKAASKARRDVANEMAEVQGELFVAELANWPLKDDIASMEIPLFSLSKNKDTETRLYRRKGKVVRIMPSAAGAATVFDKDLLLYAASQIVEAQNKGLPVSRHVKIDTGDFLLATRRGDGRASFERVADMLRRLKGTTIETNIETGGVQQTDGFSLIDNYRILSEKTRVELKKDKKTGAESRQEVTRVLSFTITISEWLFNGLRNFEVLTLDRGYFQLTRSIDRRLYEIARKHCGDQPMWKCNIDLLGEKIGTKRERFKIRDEIRKAIAADEIPEYRIALDTSKPIDDVVFYTKDVAKLHREIQRTQLYDWWLSLEKLKER